MAIVRHNKSQATAGFGYFAWAMILYPLSGVIAYYYFYKLAWAEQQDQNREFGLTWDIASEPHVFILVLAIAALVAATCLVVMGFFALRSRAQLDLWYTETSFELQQQQMVIQQQVLDNLREHSRPVSEA